MKKKILLAFVLALFSTAVVVGFIRPVEASGTWIYIKADGSVEGTDKIQRDGDVYTFTDNIYDEVVVERDNIMIDGAGYTVQGTGAAYSEGIHLWYRRNVTVRNMKIEGFCYGIFLRSSSNIIIYGNTITENSEEGVHLYGSYNNIISANNITNNANGIYIDSSNYNSISGNNIRNNDCGVYLDYSSHQNFCHNNFVDNTQQVSVDRTNVWDDDYPSGGNYWSNYTGIDAKSGSNQDQPNSDGIGDTPHTIDEDNRDRYPLMKPWTPPEHELLVSITAPTHLQLSSSSSLDAIVTNQGLKDEVDVELSLLINGTIVNSRTIPLLRPWLPYTLSYPWTPTVEGKYNVTAYAHPVTGEISIENNRNTAFTKVAEVLLGVKVGDWIKYDYTVTGPLSVVTWMKVEFLTVGGTNATVRVTIHMSDGTEQNQTMTVDVVAGEGALDTFSGFVIPANCTTGDSIYISGYGTITIASETTRTYAGARRTVVYTSFSQDGNDFTYYWDKQTGVMVEASVTSGGMTATDKATETNMWEAAPPPFWMQWWFWAIVAAGIVALAGAVYFLKRRKPPTPTAPTLPTEGTV